MAHEKNVGKRHGLGVSQVGSHAPGGTHHFISGSQSKAMSEVGHDSKHGRRGNRTKAH